MATKQDEEYLKKVEAVAVFPLWVMHAQRQERPKVAPAVWRWPVMRELAYEAGELESLKGGGERRALTMRNPGLKKAGIAGSTKTMSSAIQIVWPGEVATAHRHTAAAIRFVIEGDGAYTVQDGERFRMTAGDFVLSPSWVWHDHNNPTDEAVIWLDCLDAPMTGYFDAMFQEPFPEDVQPVTKEPGFTNATIGNGMMRPVDGGDPTKVLPLTYKWADSYGTLLAIEGNDPHDGAIMEYTNPVTGGHTMPTLACKLQRLAAGDHLDAHRHTSTVIYHVAKGEGFSIIDGQRIDWSFGDTFTLPAWAWHEHGNDSGDDAVLFSMSDLPVVEAMGLYREEDGERQEVTGTVG